MVFYYAHKKWKKATHIPAQARPVVVKSFSESSNYTRLKKSIIYCFSKTERKKERRWHACHKFKGGERRLINNSQLFFQQTPSCKKVYFEFDWHHISFQSRAVLFFPLYYYKKVLFFLLPINKHLARLCGAYLNTFNIVFCLPSGVFFV